MRVLFPVSYPVEHSVAEGSFEVRQRPVALPQPADLSEWAEAPVNTFPQKRFADLSDGTTGLAVLNRGLPEYEVLQAGPGLADGQTALALTLLRCVEWLSRGDLDTRQGHAGPMEHTPEAQCPGYYEFDYALLPHQGTWETAEALVLREAQSFNTPISTRAVVATSHPGQLASQASLIEVEPPSLVVSALKRSNNTQELIVRIYNPLDYEVDAQIRLGLAFTQVFVANLLEEHQYSLEIPANSQSIQINIRGGGITTLAFV